MAHAFDTHWRRMEVDPGPGRLTSVCVIDNLPEAEWYWRRLESEGAISTPYQGFGFLSAWHREVGSRCGVTPFVVVGFDSNERPLCLLPLGLRRTGPLCQVSFLGGKHANYNFGIWDRVAATSVTADDLQFMLRHIAASPFRPDLLALYSQPRAWRDLDNPFLLLPNRPAASNGAYLIIDAPGHEVIEREVGAATRGRLRTKERKLQKLSGYRYFRATEPGEVERLLAQFMALKTAHMTAQGLPNVFAEEGVEAFLRSACHRGLGEGRPPVELHGLEIDGELLALFGVLTDGQSLSVMINTYTLGENARHSPGLILILHLIQACAERGIDRFDLGVGEAAYKSWFCKQPINLFDSFLPLTPLGRLSAIAFEMTNTLKREVKSSSMLWNAYRGLRRAFSSPDCESRRQDSARTKQQETIG